MGILKWGYSTKKTRWNEIKGKEAGGMESKEQRDVKREVSHRTSGVMLDD